MELSAEARSVLIVDDEQDIVRPLAFRLEMEGFRVMLEPNGQLGYERALMEQPDLILLDVMMPGLDGITVCRMLKEREETALVPIIMVTAKTTVGDVEAAFAAHADDYISKPFEWAKLYSKICRLTTPRAQKLGGGQER